MADLTVTAANVVKYDDGGQETGIAGEAITAGQTLYKHTDGKMLKCDASTAAKANVMGIALCDAAAEQPVVYIKAGGLNPGAAVAVGAIYSISDTAGGIGPVSERAALDYITILGVGVTASRITLAFNRSGVAIPT